MFNLIFKDRVYYCFHCFQKRLTFSNHLTFSKQDEYYSRNAYKYRFITLFHIETNIRWSYTECDQTNAKFKVYNFSLWKLILTKMTAFTRWNNIEIEDSLCIRKVGTSTSIIPVKLPRYIPSSITIVISDIHHEQW